MHSHLSEVARYLLGVLAVGAGAWAALAAGRDGWRRLPAALLVGASALYLAYLGAELAYWLWVNAEKRADAVIYYTVAKRALAGLPLYWPWPEYGPHFGTAGNPYPLDRHLYPPFLMGALIPLAELPLRSFVRAWYVVLYAGFWIYAATLARLATGRATPARVVVAAAVLAATPGAQLALMVANVEPVLWALFGLALAVPALRGPGFTAAAMVKLYGAWPLLLAARREGWRVARGAALTLALGFGVGFLVLGPAGFVGALLDWLRYMMPVVGQGTFAVDPVHGGTNVSPSFAVLRAARALGWEYTEGPLPGWARLYLTAVAVGAPLLTAWWTRRAHPVLRYALVTVAAVVFAPLCWATYLPLLLAPVAVAVGLRRASGRGEGAIPAPPPPPGSESAPPPGLRSAARK